MDDGGYNAFSTSSNRTLGRNTAFRSNFFLILAVVNTLSSIKVCIIEVKSLIERTARYKWKKYILSYSAIECGKKDIKYIYYVKNDLFGCFKIEENVTKAMEQVWRREKE